MKREAWHEVQRAWLWANALCLVCCMRVWAISAPFFLWLYLVVISHQCLCLLALVRLGNCVLCAPPGDCDSHKARWPVLDPHRPYHDINGFNVAFVCMYLWVRAPFLLKMNVMLPQCCARGRTIGATLRVTLCNNRGDY